jgi:hypothetical protein
MKKNIIIAVFALISAASMSWNYLQPVRATADPLVSYTDTDNIGAFVLQERDEGRDFGCYQILPPTTSPPTPPEHPVYDVKVTYDRGGVGCPE